eukprot:TRINITY_DN19349_c0_g1_i1.p1 TRINITY_DN19349_c0_g1~~TRINITY_DN19349_c0_g1_i1.p1  ORF type:complete len:466 (+),score=103.37 TRINITY_DN19349_c0_g1_i1:85-1482(+)
MTLVCFLLIALSAAGAAIGLEDLQQLAGKQQARADASACHTPGQFAGRLKATDTVLLQRESSVLQSAAAAATGSKKSNASAWRLDKVTAFEVTRAFADSVNGLSGAISSHLQGASFHVRSAVDLGARRLVGGELGSRSKAVVQRVLASTRDAPFLVGGLLCALTSLTAVAGLCCTRTDANPNQQISEERARLVEDLRQRWPRLSDFPGLLGRSSLSGFASEPKPGSTLQAEKPQLTQVDSLASLPALSREAFAAAVPPSGQSSPKPLCAKLLVPEDTEYVFAIPDILDCVRQELAFTVLSLAGKALCSVQVRELRSNERALAVTFLNGKAMSRLRVVSERREVEIFEPDGNRFATVSREDIHMSSHRFLVRDTLNEILLVFSGKFRDRAVNGASPLGTLLCATRPCHIEGTASATADAAASPYYEVRVATGADAALILCSLLAIDKLQGRPRSVVDSSSSSSLLQ